MSVFTHVTVGTNNLAKARTFYDVTLREIGLKRIGDLNDAGSIWGVDNNPANGAPATIGNGVTVSFKAPNRAAVLAFHTVALANGAACEGLPGPRGWADNAYAA